VALGGLATISIVYTQFSVGAEVLLGIFVLLFLGLVACMLVGCSRVNKSTNHANAVPSNAHMPMQAMSTRL
jgi:hypothetical protein